MLAQKTRSCGVLQPGRVLFLPLGVIRPNPDQPRRVFDAAGLQELAASIRQYGVLQPLTVRKTQENMTSSAGIRAATTPVTPSSTNTASSPCTSSPPASACRAL